MASPDKWRIIYFTDGESASRWERQIVPEFEQIYMAKNKPNRMALFSHTAGDTYALSITPESVPYCESLFALIRWEQSDNALSFGMVSWVAGDERLKGFATTYFGGM